MVILPCQGGLYHPSTRVFLQGALFFDGLLQKLQVSYQFKLEDYMDGLAIRSKPLRKMVGWLPPGHFSPRQLHAAR